MYYLHTSIPARSQFTDFSKCEHTKVSLCLVYVNLTKFENPERTERGKTTDQRCSARGTTTTVSFN